MQATFVVVGGGIAGVTCAESLAFLEPEESIILISKSSLIKTVCNLYNITKTLSHFDVVEQEAQTLMEKFTNIKVIHDDVLSINTCANSLKTSSGAEITYKYLCLCMGATPKLIKQAENHKTQILGIRDTDSVEILQEKLKDAKKIAIVGNGGIASELVYKLEDIEVHWVVKDKHISATFVDPGAAEFFQSSLTKKNTENCVSKRMRYSEEAFRKSGAALGPDWYKNLTIKGGNTKSTIKIHYECEIDDIQNNNNKLNIKLTNNTEIITDLIVSATGVNPITDYNINTPFNKSEDGGILVNEFMQTSIPNIYAAGDICTTNFAPAKHWFQMKLWTQARQMGCYAAKCMSSHSKNEEILQDFCFEMFSHSTKLFGYKVILLGLYNGQKLGRDYEILLRMTKEKEYIKFVLQNNRLQGVVLIGDTDLEETCENLILNQLDLSPYGDDILNPDIDIEDYFD